MAESNNVDVSVGSEEHAPCSVTSIQECAKEDVTESQEYRGFKSELETLHASFKTEMGLAKINMRHIVDTFANLKLNEAMSQMSRVLDTVQDLQKSKDQCSIQEIQSEKPKKVIDIEFISKFNVSVKHDDSSTIDDSDSDTTASDDSSTDRSSDSATDSSSDSDAEDTSDSDDSSTCESKSRITGSTVLSDGRLAFADFDNKMIKVMFPSYGHKTAAFKLTDNPFDVTEVRRGLLVVTLPKNRKCVVFTYSEDSCEKDYHFKTRRRCYGIASIDGDIYVAVRRPPQIEVMDMDGNVLNIFAQDDKENALFSSPQYLAVDTIRDRIYVTDTKNKTITCLTKEGKVMRVYKSNGMRLPYGIAVDRSGLIYVCARSSDKLLCLDADLKLVSAIKDDKLLHKAETVAVWNLQDRLYIGIYRDDNLTAMDIKKYY